MTDFGHEWSLSLGHVCTCACIWEFHLVTGGWEISREPTSKMQIKQLLVNRAGVKKQRVSYELRSTASRPRQSETGVPA